MKKIFYIFIVILLGLSLNFCKKESQDIKEENMKSSEKYIYARYAVGLWDSLEMKKYNIYAQKGERLTILDSIEHDTGKVKLKLYKLLTTGNKEGYAEIKHFSPYIGVIFDKRPMVLERPTIAASTGYNADEVHEGMIIFSKGEHVVVEIDNQGNEWINISGTFFQPSTKKTIYFEGWIPKYQLSQTPEYIDYGLMYENALLRIAKCDTKNINEGNKMMQRLISMLCMECEHQDVALSSEVFLVRYAAEYMYGTGQIICE